MRMKKIRLEQNHWVTMVNLHLRLIFKLLFSSVPPVWKDIELLELCYIDLSPPGDAIVQRLNYHLKLILQV